MIDIEIELKACDICEDKYRTTAIIQSIDCANGRMNSDKKIKYQDWNTRELHQKRKNSGPLNFQKRKLQNSKCYSKWKSLEEELWWTIFETTRSRWKKNLERLVHFKVELITNSKKLTLPIFVVWNNLYETVITLTRWSLTPDYIIIEVS